MLSLSALGLGLAVWWLSARARLLALAPVLLVSCAPAYRIAHPSAHTPTPVLVADFALVCIAGAASAQTYNSGDRPAFLISFGTYVGLIAADTWGAR